VCGVGVRATRFDVYRAGSREIHAIFADYTALIEPLSLDEAYLDVTQDLRGLKTASATAQDIRSRIFDETGLTASAGISYNKFLAKLASGQRKPNGQFVITSAMGPNFVASLPVAKFHGVGPVTAAKMQRFDIQTGADLRTKSLAFLQQHFGKWATMMIAARVLDRSNQLGNWVHSCPLIREAAKLCMCPRRSNTEVTSIFGSL
jgi:DNA polymerase-4